MNNEKINLDIKVPTTCTCSTQTCYSVPIGPVHPALKEPIGFSFQLEGEQICGVDIKPGYAHRGIEYMGMKRNLVQVLYLSERICGICSISHPLTLTQAVEQAAGIEVPERAQYIRTIIGELERIHSHLLWAGVGAHELGFDTLLYLSWNVREKVMDLLEQLTGNRVDYAIPAYGGVRRDIPEEKAHLAYEALDYYKGLLQSMIDAFLHDKSVELRTRNVGVLTYDEAVALSAVGPTARASGVKKDVRQDMPYFVYGDIDLHAITPEDYGTTPVGDVFDNIIVRLLEVDQSIKIIEYCLENMPQGELTSIPKVAALLNILKKAEGEGIGRHEAPRGEVFHYVRLEAGKEEPTVWKVKAPTYSNLMSWVPKFMGDEVADIPIIAASIDPCMCCMDRVHLVAQDGTESDRLEEELIKLSQEKTRRVCS
jgi:membrane-bound hydrogenase subunit alpha